jgi:DNA-binding FadR family transcriptional regulator
MTQDAFDQFSFRAVNIPDQLRNILRTAIMEGRFKPGDKLPSEEQMTKQFNVSKTVLREALGKLVAEGLIEKRRGAQGGSFVSQGNSERILDVVVDCYHLGGLTIDEVIEYRRIMEPVVIELACAKRTRKNLEIMEKNLETCRQAIESGEVDRKGQVEFHSLIAQACQNRLITSAMNAAIKISREFTSKLKFSLEEGNIDFEFNCQFFDCIQDNQPERAKSIMSDHFERSRLLVERYQSLEFGKNQAISDKAEK